MWLATTTGFYSAVRGRREGTVQVRARSRADLEALRRRLPGVKARIVATPQADYPFRIILHREVWRALAWRLAIDAEDYGNFKDAVAETNPARAVVYARV